MLHLATALLLFAAQGVPVDLVLEKDEFTDEYIRLLYGVGENGVSLAMTCSEESRSGLVLIVPKSLLLPKLEPDVFMGVDFRFDDGPIELEMGQVFENAPIDRGQEETRSALLLDGRFANRFADHERLRIRLKDGNHGEFVEDFDISKVTSDTLSMCTQTQNPFR